MNRNYLPLSKERFLHKPNYVSPEEMDQFYQARLTGPATVVTNLYPLLTDKNDSQTDHYPIFYTYTRKLVRLADVLRHNSENIKLLAEKLPGVAKQQFLDSLLASEITYTNQIEGVETDRKEISTIIRENEEHKTEGNKRLQSTILMYQKILERRLIKINKLQDFRSIYDELLAGEISKDKLPNGELFRDEFSEDNPLRIGNAFKTVHVPPTDEASIKRCLTDLIAFMNQDDVPAIYKSLITHFFFENTHPFIDGNGRMGRYLLSTYLANKYDYFTGFSVATAIHARVETYYRIFREAEQTENYGELTFFMIDMLKLLADQQEQILMALKEDLEKLDRAKHKIEDLIAEISQPEADVQAIHDTLFYLALSKLFADNKQLAITDRAIEKLNSKNKIAVRKTKSALKWLEDNNLIEVITERPKRHHLLIRID